VILRKKLMKIVEFIFLSVWVGTCITTTRKNGEKKPCVGFYGLALMVSIGRSQAGLVETLRPRVTPPSDEICIRNPGIKARPVFPLAPQ
jgi:hypothetical protein